ncbi:hypothetical protein Q1695_001541 [Nippostrongylus brasiliensis]|nr:hypothetical protein Q1695_001541 [Nippostrongylus brasiliensis]
MFDSVVKALEAVLSFVRKYQCFGHHHDVRDHLLEEGSPNVNIGVYRNTVICGEWDYTLARPEYWKPTLRIECVQVE